MWAECEHGSFSHVLHKSDRFGFGNYITFFLEGRMGGRHQCIVLWLSYSSLRLAEESAYNHGQGPAPCFTSFGLAEYRKNAFGILTCFQ